MELDAPGRGSVRPGTPDSLARSSAFCIPFQRSAGNSGTASGGWHPGSDISTPGDAALWRPWIDWLHATRSHGLGVRDYVSDC